MTREEPVSMPGGPGRHSESPTTVGIDPVTVGSPGRLARRFVLVAAATVLVVLGSSAAVWLARNGGAADQSAPGGSSSPLSPPPNSATWPTASTSPSPPRSAPTTSAGRTTPTGPPGLLVRDDFSGSTPNAALWRMYESTSENGSSWRPAMVTVGGGELRILGQGTNPAGQGNLSGGLCMCGAGGNRVYGTWAVRARFEAGSGYGQVIGLWPESDDSDTGMIIFASSPTATKKETHLALAGSTTAWTSDNTNVPGDFTAWHTYKVEWRSTYVRMSIDGKVVYDSRKSTHKPFLPRVPMHLFMQQIVGPHDSVPAANASTPAKVTMHIDWVTMSTP